MKGHTLKACIQFIFLTVITNCDVDPPTLFAYTVKE